MHIINYLTLLAVFMQTLTSQPTVTGGGQESIKKKFTNPVFDGADPWFIKNGGYYYYCFSSANGISISRSVLLTKKGEIKRVWDAPAQGWNRSCVWAPELHFFNNRWYIYYAAGESGPPFIHQKTGVLESETDDPFSKYTDKGVLYTGDNPDMLSENIWAIDMNVFEWQKKLYAVWSGWEKPALTDKTSQHLYIAEMENPYTMKSPRVKLSSPEEPWETGGPLDLQEGPEVLMHTKELFIVYSCRESWRVEYRLGLLKLTDEKSRVTDPLNWEKSGPVFQGPFGTGHCSFVTSPDGREDWIAYHAKKSIKEGWQRDVRLQPFTWTKDGYPHFGEPVGAGVEINRPSGEYKLEKNLKGTK
jgi:GH43 family beta-xylosidase